MGGNQSKATAKVTNDFLTKITSDFISSTSQSVSATGGSKQTVNLSGASFNGCRVNVSQGASTTATASGTLTTENQQALAVDLQNKMAEKIAQSAEQKNGFLAPAFGNSAQTVSDVANRSNTVISSTMSSSTVQNIFAKAISNQDVNASGLWMECNPQYRLPGEYDFNLDQNIYQNITATGVADAITSAMQNDTLLNEAITDLSQKATQTNAGLDDLVKAICSGYGLIAVVIILFCCALFLLPLLFGGGGGQRAPSAQNQLPVGVPAR